ncbi:MAG TPA: ABC transporter permease [Vicinamibacterales bacterium]|nr:ABC transporter permease [Vicinamibacterales bacterium]
MTSRGSWGVRAGRALLLVLGVATLLAPWLAPNDPDRSFADRTYAPPTKVHLRDAHGWRAPFIYRQTLVDRGNKEYAEDRTVAVPLRFLSGGRLVTVEGGTPLLLLGGDDLGRDVFARLVHGARLSIGVALAGVVGAVLIGAWVGALAGSVGGWLESTLMFVADYLIVLPAAYLVLVLRGVLPEVLSTAEVFALMAALFALAGWPLVARGVRAIVASERDREYAEAARSLGVGSIRLARQLLPAAGGFIAVQVMLLVPALVLAEVTISFLGLGFTANVSWGTMLRTAGSIPMMRDAPWMLAPAAALFVLTLGCQLLAGKRGSATVLQLASVDRTSTRR